MIRSLYYGIVVNDNDPDIKSKIQVRIIPELKDVKESLLPWVKPFSNLGMNAESFSHTPPEIDSHIWVFFTDKYWRKGYYIPGRIIEGLFDFNKWDDSEIPDKDSSEYPNPRFHLTPDNSIIFYDTITGDKGIYNSNGSYILMKGNGEIYIYSKDQIQKLYNDNGFLELKATGEITTYSKDQVQKMYNDSGYIELKANGQIDISGNFTVDP